MLTFSEFLQTTKGKVCVEKSDYHTHIDNWLKVIRRDQVLQHSTLYCSAHRNYNITSSIYYDNTCSCL